MSWNGWVEVIIQATGVFKHQASSILGCFEGWLFATNPRVFVDSWLIFWFYSAFFALSEGSSS